MKYIDAGELNDVCDQMLEETDTFKFCCYPEVSCFNMCCRNLNLFLSPYDVIRLKQSLTITSTQFIDEYTDIVVRPGRHFPDVLLRMRDDDQKSCVFKTESGCRVYSDRPQTCRAFPVEHGLLFDADKKQSRLVLFFRPPDFCKGKYEKTTWTWKKWESDQEAAFYNTMNGQWADIIRLFQNEPFKNDPWGGEGPMGQKGKMAFMAAYNMDDFRDFVLNSSFLKRYKIKSKVKMKIRLDDVALLKLGMAWIKMFLFGIQTKDIKLKR